MKKIVITLLLALMAMPLSSSVNTASAKTIASEQVADKKPKKKAEKKKKDLNICAETLIFIISGLRL